MSVPFHDTMYLKKKYVNMNYLFHYLEIIISNRLYFSLPRIMAGPVEAPAFCQNLERYTWNSPIYLTSLVIRHLLN